MAKGVHQAINFNNKTMSSIFVLLVGAFMLIVPFYRGLFFRVDYLPAITFISIVFAVYMFASIKDKTGRVLGTYMDISVLLIPASYLIAFFFAANAKDAFDMLLLYCSYFMLYKLVSELSAKNEKFKNTFINVLIASTFILSFTSILSISGVISMDAAYEGRRLFGLYQYPNTTASVLGVGIILSLNKMINAESIKLKAVYQSVLTALMPVFIFTLSRGGYLVLAAVLLLNFFLIAARKKVKFLLGILVYFLSGSLFIIKYYTVPEAALNSVLIYYLISIAASAIIIYMIYALKNLTGVKLTEKAINRTLILIALTSTVALIFLFSVKEPIEYKLEHQVTEEGSYRSKGIILNGLSPDMNYSLEFDVKASLESPHSYGVIINSFNSKNQSTEILNIFEAAGPEFIQKSLAFQPLEETETIGIYLYNYEKGSYTVYKNIVIRDSNGNAVKKIEKPKYIPLTIAERIADITLTTENVSSRMLYVKDGIKIIKDYPIVGAGGGAWRSLYRHYQSMPYFTAEAHNFYVQYGTEVGIIGLAALISLLVLLVISMVRSVRKGSQYLHIYLAAMLLFLHSSIDFNLSLSAVAYVLWMLIGIINSEKNTHLLEKLPQRQIGATALVLSLVVLIASSSMRYGIKLGAEGAIASQEKADINKIMKLYESAAKLDRFNGVYRIDLAQILNNELRKTKDKRYYDETMEQIKLLRKYEPHNHEFTSMICNILLSLGKFEEASKLADTIVIDEPMIDRSYKLKIDVNFQIASYYERISQLKEGIPYLKKVMETKDEVDELSSKQSVSLNLGGDYLKKIEAASEVLKMLKADTEN